MPLKAPASVAAPAASDSGFVTFGCLNNLAKVSDRCLSTWAQLLRDVPNSRILMHSHLGSHRERLLDQIAKHGADPRRMTFIGHVAPQQYFQAYAAIDIALDPFPCNGATTTCDALWMGVPVVGLAGQIALHRAGLSILSNVGLAELVGETTWEYIRIATALANDLPRLTELRSTLRTRMQASPLMDGPRLARDVEMAFRTMWRRWCAAGENIH
jgi:predicted O-linked N-acetylglucosamine transferase (SPINDLY family)